MPVTLIKSKWSSGNLVFYPGTDDTGALHFGDGTTDMDFKVFLGSTTEFVLFDVGESRVDFELPIRFGANQSVAVPITWGANVTSAVGAFSSSGTLISDSTASAPSTTSGYVTVNMDGASRYVYLYDAVPGS